MNEIYQRNIVPVNMGSDKRTVKIYKGIAELQIEVANAESDGTLTLDETAGILAKLVDLTANLKGYLARTVSIDGKF
jgi:hypothetical protein